MKGYFLCLFLFLNVIHLDAKEENFYEHKWMERYFSAPDRGTIEETIDFLLAMKLDLYAKGILLPKLSTLFLQVQEILDQEGIFLEKEEVDSIYHLLLQREEQCYSALSCNGPLLLTSKKTTEPDKMQKIPVGTIFGIAKMLAGVICCVVPNAHSIETGIFLIGDGVRSIANAFADREVAQESAGLPLR